MLRIGVIGLGNIWQWRHKPALKELQSKFSVQVVCDIREEIAKKEAIELNCDYTLDFSEVVERGDLDCISILTPPWIRLDIIKMACARELPIYCEKPLDIDLGNARTSARLVRESGTVFTTEFVRRFFPATYKLRELLETSLGKPRMVFCNSETKPVRGSWQDWMQSQELSGGYMMDFGIHLVDFCRFILQAEAETVLSSGGKYINTADDLNDYESMLIEFEDNTIGQIDVRRNVKDKWASTGLKEAPAPFTIVADRGIVYFDPWKYVKWYDDYGYHAFSPSPGPDIGVVMYNMFFDFINGKAIPTPDIDDALKAVEIVLAGTKSRALGRKINMNELG